MASAVDSIAQYLATDLAFGTLGGTVFEDALPDAADGSLDTCTAVFSLPGGQPSLALKDSTDNPGFQIVCRSLDADTARANDLAAYQALHGLTETDVHGTYFHLITAIQSGPTPLGRDEKQRFVYSRSYRSFTTGVVR